MLRTTLTAVSVMALALPVMGQQTIADFDFESDSLVSSASPSFATVSDLAVSNNFVYGGGGSDRWLCLTTAWNNAGGTISFTVTPNAGESIDYAQLSWTPVTNSPGTSDSVRSVTVSANGVVLGTVDPIVLNTTESIDLTGFASLQGNSGPVTFLFDYVGNPTGQSSHEIGYIRLTGDNCVPVISSVTPASLPTVTDQCFQLRGDCFDLITNVFFDGTEIHPTAFGVFGDGSYEVIDRRTLEVCPPQCIPGGTYDVRILTASGASQSTTVTLNDPTTPVLACAPSHPTGARQCMYASAGGLPGPNVIFIVLSDSNLPSVIPGVINVGLGNNFTNYLCDAGVPGDCVEYCLGPIPANMVGITIYFQGIVWNMNNLVVPIPTTNVCATTYQ